MNNDIYFKLIAGSLGAGTLLAFSLLVGLTAGGPVNEYPSRQQPVASPVVNLQSNDNGPIIRTMATEQNASPFKTHSKPYRPGDFQLQHGSWSCIAAY